MSCTPRSKWVRLALTEPTATLLPSTKPSMICSPGISIVRSPPLIPVNTSTPLHPTACMLSKATRLTPVASKMMSNGPYSLAASLRGILRVLMYRAPRASDSSLLNVGGSVRASVVTSKPRSRRMSVARLEPAYVRPNLQYAPERLVADNQELVTHRSFAILGAVDFLVSPIHADAQHLH